MTNKESLETGLHPFVFDQHNADEQERAADIAALYDFVTGQHAGASLADTQTLMGAESLSLPQLFSHARGLIQRCRVWYATFFGYDHPVVEGHTKFVEAMLLGEAEYEILIPSNNYMKHFVPTLFVRYFQLRLCNWLNRQWRSQMIVDAPDFCDLFERIAVGEQWEPRLPLKYELALQRSAGGTDTLMVGSSGNNGGVGKLLKDEDDTNGEGRGPPQPGGEGQLQNKVVRNDKWKEDLFRPFHTLPLRVRTVLSKATSPPPLSPHDPAKKAQMCVAWHIKGMCNERCRRAIDHKHHTDAQDAALVEWCKKNYRSA